MKLKPPVLVDYQLAATVVRRLLNESKIREKDRIALEVFVVEALELAKEQNFKN